MKIKKNYFVIFVFFVFKLYSSDLDILYNKLTMEYGEFGFIVTNPQNGEIKMSYNNDMIFYNKYCPGSLLKPFALIAVSKTSQIDQFEMYDCLGEDVRSEISCWLRQGHGKLNLVSALANSCNYYFYYFLKDKLVKAAYIDTLKEFGMFYSDANFMVNKTDFVKLSFGLSNKYQVYPIDIIMAYSSLFNGGRLFNREKNMIKKIKLDRDLIDIINQGMKEGYLYGTSRYILEKTKIVDIFAKTGTGPNNDKIINSWNDNTGWVALFYPSNTPEFGMLVVVKNGGSSVASKIASDILIYLNKKQ